MWGWDLLPALLIPGLARIIYIYGIRYFWQENHQLHGHLRFKYTVLANPNYRLFLQVPCDLSRTYSLETNPAACALSFFFSCISHCVMRTVFLIACAKCVFAPSCFLWGSTVHCL